MNVLLFYHKHENDVIKVRVAVFINYCIICNNEKNCTMQANSINDAFEIFIYDRYYKLQWSGCSYALHFTTTSRRCWRHDQHRTNPIKSPLLGEWHTSFKGNYINILVSWKKEWLFTRQQTYKRENVQMTKKLTKLLNISLFYQVDCAKKLEMLVLDHTHPTDHSLNSDFSCVLVLVSSLTAASGFSQALRISLYHYIYNPGSYSNIISYEFLF